MRYGQSVFEAHVNALDECLALAVRLEVVQHVDQGLFGVSWNGTGAGVFLSGHRLPSSDV